MTSTKMLNYQNWKKYLENNGFSDSVQSLQQSVCDKSLKTGGYYCDSANIEQLKGGVPGMLRDKDERNLKVLIDDLKKMCKKEAVFRKERVDKLKVLIKNKQYYVPGRLVVEKWFPE